MQGTFVRGQRPATKKALKEAIALQPEHVQIEATSVFGNEFDGYLTAAPRPSRIDVVGPDPYTSRKWYANIDVAADGTVTIR